MFDLGLFEDELTEGVGVLGWVQGDVLVESQGGALRIGGWWDEVGVGRAGALLVLVLLNES